MMDISFDQVKFWLTSQFFCFSVKTLFFHCCAMSLQSNISLLVNSQKGYPRSGNYQWDSRLNIAVHRNKSKNKEGCFLWGETSITQLSDLSFSQSSSHEKILSLTEEYKLEFIECLVIWGQKKKELKALTSKRLSHFFIKELVNAKVEFRIQ